MTKKHRNNDLTVRVRPEILEIQDTIIETRRDFHKYPELGFEVHRTAGIVSDRLNSFGLDVQTGIGKTGVVGTLQGKKDGPTIALRADMDALPIQETSDIPYKSVHDGVMHACGHDGHTAMLLGAAEIISQFKNSLKGKVKFIFQPAEEGGGGAQFMIEDGCLEGVDEIYGIHVWSYQKYGTVGVKEGPILAAADAFTITIKGKGGHGAAPQGTVDAIVVASHLVTTLQTIVSRNTNPLESTALTVGKISGGHNFNVIADTVELKGTARAYTEDNRQMIKKRLKEIIDGVGKTYGAKIEMDYWDGYPPTVNHKVPVEKLVESAGKIVGDGVGFPYLSMGGEDFSYYSQIIPGCFFFVGSTPPDQKPMSVPHHCSHFNIDERALLVGSSIYVQLIEDLLVNKI